MAGKVIYGTCTDDSQYECSTAGCLHACCLPQQAYRRRAWHAARREGRVLVQVRSGTHTRRQRVAKLTLPRIGAARAVDRAHSRLYKRMRYAWFSTTRHVHAWSVDLGPRSHSTCTPGPGCRKVHPKATTSHKKTRNDTQCPGIRGMSGLRPLHNYCRLHCRFTILPPSSSISLA